MFFHLLKHAFLDTLTLLPFLLVTYLIMEAIEYRASNKTVHAIEKAGAAGPLIGSLIGVVPQCGFSAAAATLWSGRVITVGTMIAVMLSTSDELLPIFIAEQAPLSQLLAILGTKVAVAIIAGFAVDLLLKALRFAGDGRVHIHELCEREHCGCDDKHAGSWLGVVKSALIHTLQISLFIFILTFLVGIAIEFVGEDALAEFMAGNPVLSVLASALVGLIPNCAASVVIAELFLNGTIGSAALLAGSLTSAGVGLLVLFRTNSRLGQNFLIVCALYVFGAIAGLIMLALGLSF